MNFFVPERAIVPMFSITSAWSIPIPLSLIVNVLASLLVVIVTANSSSSVSNSELVKASKRRLSIASELLEISSRRKISFWL